MAETPRTEVRIGDPLPRSNEATIDPAKLRNYALDTDHPVGGAKARVFRAVLAIRRNDWEHLRDEILLALPDGRVTSVNEGKHTTTYGVILSIQGLNGRSGHVLTAWKLSAGVPRLVSARIDRESLLK
jgi:hypothetical protein